MKVSLASTVSPCSTPAVIDADVTLKNNANVAVTAALSGNGAPTAYVYRANFGRLLAGRGRVMIAHAAEPSPVRVTLATGSGSATVSLVQPGTERSTTVDSRLYTATVFAQGVTGPLLGLIPLAVGSRDVVLVFAVGSAASGSLRLLTTTVPNVQ